MGYAWAAGATITATLVALGLDAYFHVVNVALVYLIAVVLVALRYGRGPVVAVSVLNVAAFNFFFIPPRGTFQTVGCPLVQYQLLVPRPAAQREDHPSACVKLADEGVREPFGVCRQYDAVEQPRIGPAFRAVAADRGNVGDPERLETFARFLE